MAVLAKTSRPRQHRVFTRSHLFRRLDVERRRASAVWLEGPPGAGKTTLLSSYVARRKLRCLWFRVDAGDDDLATFFYYLGLAARSLSRSRRPMPLFTAEYLGAPTVFAKRFFRELCRRLGPEFVLVFDNCHEVPTASPFHAVLRDGLTEVPPGASALLASRTEPPPAMAALLASGALRVVAPDELRLSLRESIGIAALRGAAGPRDARRIHERVRGWAAGLVLLIERATRGHVPDGEGGGAESIVFEYLASELFEQLDPQTRRVLLVTALVPRPSRRVAEALTGISRAARILEDLAHRGYFTTSVDGPEPAFEFHPLFREFLLARGRVELGADEQRSLAMGAADLLAAEGRVEDAVDLLRNAGAWDELAALVLQSARGMVETGRMETLGRWIEALPRKVQMRRPWLVYWRGIARMPFDSGGSRRELERAYELFRDGGDARGVHLSWAAAVETYIQELAGLAALDRWIGRLDELRRFATPLDPEIQTRVALATYIALGFRCPDHPEFLAWEDRMLRMAMDPEAPPHLRVTAGQYVIVLTAMRGELARTRVAMGTLSRLARRPGVGPLEALTWMSAEAVHHWGTGNCRRAVSVVRECLELASDTGVHLWDFILNYTGALASIGADDLSLAREFLAAAATLLDPARTARVLSLEHARGELALRLGDLHAAMQHAAAVLDSGARAGQPFGLVIGHLVAARALARRGDHSEAERHVAGARQHARAATCSSLVEFVASFESASIALARGRTPAAVEHLQRGLALGREKELGSALWIPRDQMATLCGLALEHGVEVDEARRIIRERRLVPASALSPEQWPWPVRIRLLGRFEVERDGEVVHSRGKVQRRPLQLLALLAASPGRDLERAHLAAVLWPDADGDAAQHALETTMYRLRRLLGHEEAIVRADGHLRLDAGVCWTDTLALATLLAGARDRLRVADGATEALALTARALSLYRGPLAAPEPEDLVIIGARERLRREMAHHLAALSARCRSPAERAAATDLQRRAADADPALAPAP